MKFVVSLEPGKEIGIEEIISNISNAFEFLSGDEIAERHNNICLTILNI